MNCENIFCIYWDEHVCTLENIDIDSAGCCESCIYVEFEKNELDKLRKKQLQEYENLP